MSQTAFAKSTHPAMRDAAAFRAANADFYGGNAGQGAQPSATSVPAAEPRPAPNASANTQPATPPDAGAVTPPAQPAAQPKQETAGQYQYASPADIPLPAGYEHLLGGMTPPAPKQEPADDYKAKYEQLQAEMAETRKQLEESKKVADDLKALREERDLNKIMEESGANLKSLDPEDAKKILRGVMRSLDSNKQATEQRVKQLEDDIAKRREAEAKAMEEARGRQVMAEIAAAHPDIANFMQTEAYRKAMIQPVAGGSGLLVGQLVSAEFQRGNSAYIIEVLNAAKRQAGQDMEQVASVSPSAGATAPGSAKPANERMSPEETGDLLNRLRTGQIGLDEFRSIRAKHRGDKAS